MYTWVMLNPALDRFSQALEQAQAALQRGDKSAARRWARQATQLAPEREEGWLLLAAVAAPQASPGYLRQALRVNPASQRARAGLIWAQERVDRAAQTAATRQVQVRPPVATAPVLAATAPLRMAAPVKAQPQRLNGFQIAIFILLPLIFVSLLTLAIWSLSPTQAAQASPLLAPSPRQGLSWALAALQKPTATPTETPTVTPSPSPSPSPSATPAPTETATLEPTPTALPTDPGPGGVNQAAQSTPVAPYTGGKSILVDISDQWLYAYENETLVFSFVASTGMGNSTRVGTFAVQSKYPNAYGATWNIWMPSWLGIYYSGSLENGIHALPILSNGATLWSGYLGTPVSFGCVVLDGAAAQQLYDWAEIGTPVIIQW